MASTGPRHALRSGEADLALAGGVTVMSTAMGYAGFTRRAAWPPTAAARPSRTPRTGPAGPRASACSSSSASRTPAATATRSSPCCAAPPSTRTVPPTG
ncbi:beta-ketoacyl synthase N-terminal-like domain-containing protein [Streptomyces griseus]|uniref:beta-ketoacyl synthase N-terminal-like domain-containing protein n=1 Tax=Streptomyces griseus TaxID=1911 RepID=UPI0037DA4D50